MSDATCAATGAGGDVLTIEKIQAVSRTEWRLRLMRWKG